MGLGLGLGLVNLGGPHMAREKRGGAVVLCPPSVAARVLRLGASKVGAGRGMAVRGRRGGGGHQGAGGEGVISQRTSVHASHAAALTLEKSHPCTVRSAWLGPGLGLGLGLG